MSNASAGPPGPARYRYLPILSFLLSVLSVVLLVKLYMRHPLTEQGRRMESFGSALEMIPRHYAGTAPERDLYEGAMRGMVDSLRDPYSGYLNRFQMESADVMTEGEFGGVGVAVNPCAGGAIITLVQEGSPAAAADLKPGDVIVGVDGVDASAISINELVSRIRGKIGSKVVLMIQRTGTSEKTSVELKRIRIMVDSVVWRMLEGGIGCITLNQFDAHCTDNVRKALDEFQKDKALKALLIDLRGNGGGVLTEAVALCDLFLDQGTIVTVTSRLKSEQQAFEAKAGTAVPPDLPMAVLVDKGSASASEVVAGALQSHGRVTLIGTRTFGKGAVNRIFVLPDRSGVMLTVAHYTAGKGKEIDGKGLEPDVKVGELPDPPPRGNAEEGQQWLQKYHAAQKEQFDRAVEFLTEKVH